MKSGNNYDLSTLMKLVRGLESQYKGVALPFDITREDNLNFADALLHKAKGSVKSTRGPGNPTTEKRE